MRDWDVSTESWYQECGLFISHSLHKEDFQQRMLVESDGQESYKLVTQPTLVGDVQLKRVKRCWTFHLEERPSAVFTYTYKGAPYKRIRGKTDLNAVETLPNQPRSHNALTTESFEFLSPIGEGTFATVWKGVYKSDGSDVAIKAGKVSGHGSKLQAVSESIAEFHTLIGFHGQPHIVQGLHLVASMEPFEAMIIMELCEISVADALKKVQFDPLHPAQRCTSGLGVSPTVALQQMCQGLSVLHRKGVLHRDIKPGNMLIRKRGELVLSDLGDAASVEEAAVDPKVVYTCYYRAPEIYMGGHATPHSDVWAMCPSLSTMCVCMQVAPVRLCGC